MDALAICDRRNGPVGRVRGVGFFGTEWLENLKLPRLFLSRGSSRLVENCQRCFLDRFRGGLDHDVNGCFFWALPRELESKNPAATIDLRMRRHLPLLCDLAETLGV